uniref:Ovule protein n=1 Tax=Haemonchus placei TaxID=6290 RepID=A0A0N4X4G9_HAEPC
LILIRGKQESSTHKSTLSTIKVNRRYTSCRTTNRCHFSCRQITWTILRAIDVHEKANAPMQFDRYYWNEQQKLF